MIQTPSIAMMAQVMMAHGLVEFRRSLFPQIKLLQGPRFTMPSESLIVHQPPIQPYGFAARAVSEYIARVLPFVTISWASG